MLAWIKTTPDNITIIIIDSAPAAFVHREIKQHFHQHYRNCVVLFPPAPQQTRGSEDCGIFVIIGVIRLLRDLAFTPVDDSLVHEIRSILSDSDAPRQANTLKLLTAAVTMHGGGIDRRLQAAQIVQDMTKPSSVTKGTAGVDQTPKAPVPRQLKAQRSEQPPTSGQSNVPRSKEAQSKSSRTIHPFAKGHQSPTQPMAHTPLSVVIRLINTVPPPSTLPSLVMNALARSTQQEHRRFLTELTRYPAHLHDMPLDRAIVTQVEALRKERRCGR